MPERLEAARAELAATEVAISLILEVVRVLVSAGTDPGPVSNAHMYLVRLKQAKLERVRELEAEG
jgi:hypothetical protein